MSKIKSWKSKCGKVKLYCGDCTKILPRLKAASVDAIITDPPYPEISRKYGRFTELEWFELINPVMRESRRVLTEKGSGVYILQQNSEKIGKLRLWLFEYLLKWGREWNMVQDVWWWNIATIPMGLSTHGKLCRPSLKICAWFGEPDCYRNQDAVLLTVNQEDRVSRLSDRQCDRINPSGHRVNQGRMAAASERRGGATPFNVLPIPNNSAVNSKREHKHAATTPPILLDWWIRYITKPGDVILDPFLGTGTAGVVAIERGRKFIGIERDPGYFDISVERTIGALAKPHLID